MDYMWGLNRWACLRVGFCPHNGLKSDIAACPLGAMNRHGALSITSSAGASSVGGTCVDQQKSADPASLMGILAKIGFSSKERSRMNLPTVQNSSLNSDELVTN
jgi:hypothetical protein